MEETFKVKDWLKSLGIGRTTLWRMMKDGRLPPPDHDLGTAKRPNYRWNKSTVESFQSNQNTTPSS